MYTPVANEIINVGSWSKSDMCEALADVLRKLGHVNVHTYEYEFAGAYLAEEHEHTTSVLVAMVNDVRALSPESLTFDMRYFPEHKGIYWGWSER